MRPKPRTSIKRLQSSTIPQNQPTTQGRPRGRPRKLARGGPPGRSVTKAREEVREEAPTMRLRSNSLTRLTTSSTASSSLRENQNESVARHGLRQQIRRPNYRDEINSDLLDLDCLEDSASSLQKKTLSPGSHSKVTRGVTTNGRSRADAWQKPSVQVSSRGSSSSQTHRISTNLSAPRTNFNSSSSNIQQNVRSKSDDLIEEFMNSAATNSEDEEMERPRVGEDHFVEIDRLAPSKTNYRLKVFIKNHPYETDQECEIRRFRMKLIGPSIYVHFCSQLRSMCPSLARKNFVLQWKDRQGDMITVSSRAELEEALRVMRNYKVMEFYAKARHDHFELF